MNWSNCEQRVFLGSLGPSEWMIIRNFLWMCSLTRYLTPWTINQPITSIITPCFVTCLHYAESCLRYCQKRGARFCVRRIVFLVLTRVSLIPNASQVNYWYLRLIHWSPSYHICLLKFYFWVLLSERMSIKQGCRKINAVFLQPSPSSAGKNVKAASGMKWCAAWNLFMHFVFITWNASLLTLIPFHFVQSVDRKR